MSSISVNLPSKMKAQLDKWSKKAAEIEFKENTENSHPVATGLLDI
jgi:hypothetical protein